MANLKKLLNQNLPTVGTRIYSRWGVVTEAVGAAGGYDYVEFLAEYAPFSQEDLEHIAMAAELHNLDSIIKIDYQNRGYVAQKAVAAGFTGVLFTDCHNVQEVEESIRYITPDTPEDKGLFGCPSRRFTRFGGAGNAAYIEMVRNLVVGVMIEKKGAMDDIEAILSNPRVDFIQWGPTDYSMNIGVAPRKTAPEVRDVELKLWELCQKYNKPFRAEVGDVADAQFYLDLGVKHFNMGDELSNNMRYWRTNAAGLREKL